jgi:hypothetical protein
MARRSGHGVGEVFGLSCYLGEGGGRGDEGGTAIVDGSGKGGCAVPVTMGRFEGSLSG